MGALFATLTKWVISHGVAGIATAAVATTAVVGGGAVATMAATGVFTEPTSLVAPSETPTPVPTTTQQATAPGGNTGEVPMVDLNAGGTEAVKQLANSGWRGFTAYLSGTALQIRFVGKQTAARYGLTVTGSDGFAISTTSGNCNGANPCVSLHNIQLAGMSATCQSAPTSTGVTVTWSGTDQDQSVFVPVPSSVFDCRQQVGIMPAPEPAPAPAPVPAPAPTQAPAPTDPSVESPTPTPTP